MASKDLIKALSDPHLNEEEKREAAIRCARHHHMGFEPLARLTLSQPGGGGGGAHCAPPGTLPQISQERLELRT